MVQEAPVLAELLAYLSRRFPAADVEESVPLLWQSTPSDPQSFPIRRLSLALDGSCCFDGDFDALLIHRPFDLPQMSPDVPIIALHAPFDRHLTPGHHPAFVEMLGANIVSDLWRTGQAGRKERIGWIAEIANPVSWEESLRRIETIFGGLEKIAGQIPCEPVRRIAVAEAMTPETVRDAAIEKSQIYVTGQIRAKALSAAGEMAVIGTGHRRWEIWGLRQLGRELADSFPGLNVTLLDGYDTI